MIPGEEVGMEKIKFSVFPELCGFADSLTPTAKHCEAIAVAAPIFGLRKCKGLSPCCCSCSP